MKNAASPHSELLEIVLLIAAWFGEHPHGILQTREACLTSDEIERRPDAPLSPCIIAAGDDIWSPEEYMLLLDGHVVATAPEFDVALRMLFASYFSFHICYAQEVSSTLEFIQRALFGINPDRGSKGKNGRTQVNKRVLNLFQRITESQWNI
ncbi:uncharacterized protein LOC121048194 [Ixodes scapularis]|uniref:uncharacterized protein LOC121048194 n=1 Tax=Ixodes scapularis TaxID=6945 RepID=UPI001C391677|nr:uncharacterized protein LOC121048194 [Ixodes scapularis]